MSSPPQGSDPTFSAAPTAYSSAPSFTPCRIHRACYEYDEFLACDASRDLTRPCHGWPELVDTMVHRPGLESFQAFRDLNIKSLLHYQAELAQLRQELHALEWEDHRKGGESSLFNDHIGSLLASEMASWGRQEQLSKVKQIREVLKNYNAALLQYAEIKKLPKAEAFNVRALRRWIDSKFDTSLTIRGPGADSWGNLAQKRHEDGGVWSQLWKLLKILVWKRSHEDHLDLVVPGKEENTDPLTRWVAYQGKPFWQTLTTTFKPNLGNAFKRYALWLFLCRKIRHTDRESEEELPHHAPDKRNPPATSTVGVLLRKILQHRTTVESGNEDKFASLATYSMSGIIRVTNFVATIIACLLPIVGITVLSEVHTKGRILGVIAVFTAVFAIGILILTDSRTSRTEVFAATAAFAAVLVVFVQNQGPASG